MDPATIALITALAPTGLSALKWGLVATFGWLAHRSHNQTVQAVVAAGAQTAQVTATTTAQAVLTALQAGTAPKDLGKIAGQTALGAAVGAIVANPPQLGPPADLAPSAVPAPTAGG